MPHLSAGLGEGKRVKLRDKLPLSSLYIICVIGGALAAVAHHAPELTGTELRVLLHLCATAAAANSLSVPASSRDLEVATRTARSAIVTALDGLAKRGLIATRQGTPRSPATHLLRLLEVATISGPLRPPRQQQALFPQGAVLIQDRSGPEWTTPNGDSTACERRRNCRSGRCANSGGYYRSIVPGEAERLRSGHRGQGRRWMQSYRAKLGALPTGTARNHHTRQTSA